MSAIIKPITKAIIASMSLNDLLGVPTLTPKAKVKATQGTKVPRVVLTAEELKAKRNEAQKALRSTPEGRAYANEASKRSIAKKKARLQMEMDTLKALVDAIKPEVIVEAIQEAVVEVAVEKVTKKVAKKASKNSKAVVEAEAAPF